jgi:hypothetical protein
MRDLSAPLAPSTFGPGGGKKKKMGGGKCHTKSTSYGICGPKKKKEPTKAGKVVANLFGGALPIAGGIAAGLIISGKKNK